MTDPVQGSNSRPTKLQQWLKIDPLKRPKVYEQVYGSAEFASLNYWLGIVFSAGIATFGLIQDSPAVIIGAMLISPLMGPIMATGLGLAVGDLYLTLKALANLILSVAVAVGLSAFIVWLLPFHSATSEILARTNPTLLDLGIALFSGLAGSVLVARAGGGDGVTALPGVAIAVALMPPLCTVGFGMGSSLKGSIMGGAGLLFLTNLMAIVSSAFVVFLLIGMNSEELAEQMEMSRQGEFLTRHLGHGKTARALTHTGSIGWRILMLLALLGSVALPLKRAFVQVTADTAARNAVQDTVKDLLPRDALLSQQVEVGRDDISVRLFATKQVSAEKQKQAQELIAKRSGRKTNLTISTVASQSEFAQMLSKMSAAQTLVAVPPVPPPPPSIEQVQKQLIERVGPVLDDSWPPEAPLARFDITLSSNGIIIDADYQSTHTLTPIALGLITKQLQDKLDLPQLSLQAHRMPVPRKTPGQKARK